LGLLHQPVKNITKIKALDSKIGNLTLLVTVVKILPSTMQNRNISAVLVSDDTRTVQLNLHGKQADKIRVGQKLKLSRGIPRRKRSARYRSLQMDTMISAIKTRYNFNKEFANNYHGRYQSNS
jgi:hypothetical protein